MAAYTCFWVPLYLLLLASIFKQKWDPSNENRNIDVLQTNISLSRIEVSVSSGIWCSANFDRQLHTRFTRWLQYYYGIRPSLISLLLIGGDIELNPGPTRNLNVAYSDARSLVNKSASLEVDVYNNFDIIAVTETHLVDSVNSAELFSSNFRVFRCDRNRRGEVSWWL